MCWGLSVFSLFTFFAISSSAATLAPPNCPEHVERTYQKRLKNLFSEGIITVDDKGEYKPLWSTSELYKDPRFRNFPAISLEQIRWCPQIATVESSVSFLTKVGFHPQNIDAYFKKLLYSYAAEGLSVSKDQVGIHDGRQSLVEWAAQDSHKKSYAAHYAMAIHKDPSKNDKITARAGSTFIGIFQEYAIYTLPYHAMALGDAEKKCEDFEFYFPKTPKKPLKAEKTIFVLPNLDIAFCALKLETDHDALKPVRVNTSPVSKMTPLFTLGVGTDKKSQKLQLTIDDSDECQSLVEESEGALYESGALKVTTQRWAMGCDVSEGNSGDGVYNKATGEWVGIVTSRAAYTYQTLAPQIFTGKLSKERLYLETSHFVPLSQMIRSLRGISPETLSEQQQQWREWMLAF